MLRPLSNILLKFFLQLHSFSYRMISVLVIWVHGDIHPKHHLLKYDRFFLDNIEPQDRILDIGCGQGELTHRLANKAGSVLGIDRDPRKIRFAQKHFSAPNITYKIGDATRILAPNKFEVIILSNVLEHIPKRGEFLRALKKLGPKILIRVPMLNRDWLTLYKKELNLKWRLDPTHCIEYTLPSLRKEIEKAGLNIQKYSIQFGEIWAVVI